MTIEDAICERLAADSAVATLVSTRVYQVKLPQKPTLPAVRVQLIDEPKGYHLRGAHGSTRALVQVDAFASESVSDPKAAVDAVAAAIDASLSGQRFAAGGSPAALQIMAAFRQSRQPLYEAGELRLVRVTQDFIVWWKAA